MTDYDHTGGKGLRVARALLGLLEDHGVDDFRAAEEVLAGQKELAHILRLLGDFKLEQSPEDEEPASLERLGEIVKDELLSMSIAKARIVDAVNRVSKKPLSISSDLPMEKVIQRLLQEVEKNFQVPVEQAAVFVSMLRLFASETGPEFRDRVQARLRKFATQAIAENIIFFPTLNAIAQLRTNWAPTSLPFKGMETREHLIARLFKDAERLAPERMEEITDTLVKEGMRSPADRAIAATLRNQKKAHAG